MFSANINKTLTKIFEQLPKFLFLSVRFKCGLQLTVFVLLGQQADKLALKVCK